MHFEEAAVDGHAKPKIYRPTVAIILWERRVRGREKLLLVRSAKAARAFVPATVWYFPQGGIKKRETPEEAARRELKDELGIRAVHLGDFSPPIAKSRLTGRPRSVDPKRNPRDKEYTLLAVEFLGTLHDLVLKEDEIAEADLVTSDEAAYRIHATNQPAKADFLLTGIESSYKLICA